MSVSGDSSAEAAVRGPARCPRISWADAGVAAVARDRAQGMSARAAAARSGPGPGAAEAAVRHANRPPSPADLLTPVTAGRILHLTAGHMNRQTPRWNLTIRRSVGGQHRYVRGGAETSAVRFGFLALPYPMALPRPALAVGRWRALLAPGGTVGFSWSLAQDPRWEPVMAAVDTHIPPPASGFEAFLRRPPFGGIDPVKQMLTSHGFRAVETVTCQVETVYDSPEQWWAACQSQAPWAISWRHIPAGQFPAARTAAFGELERIEGPGGTLTFAGATAGEPVSSGELKDPGT